MVANHVLQFAAASALLLLATSAFADNTLRSGEALFPGQQIVSDDCRSAVRMEHDGNLTVFALNERGRVWSSNTPGVGRYLKMQSDGNLVIRNYDNRVVWQTSTAGEYTDYAVMQNDGNFVLKVGLPPRALWSSRTSRDYSDTAPCSLGSTENMYFLAGGDFDLPGHDYDNRVIPANPEQCAYLCSQDSRCEAFTYTPPTSTQSPRCWRKTTSDIVGQHRPGSGFVSGEKRH